MVNIEIEQYRRDIEAIKLSLIGLPDVTGCSVGQVLVESIQYLLNSSSILGKELLILAVIHIEAYLEMGFLYDEQKELFDSVLEALNLNKNILFPRKFYKATTVKLNRNSIRRMIKKWPKTKDRQYTIEELIDDIMIKVKSRQIGVYYYQSTQGQRKTIVGMYELVVHNDECYFHDILCKKYYVFENE